MRILYIITQADEGGAQKYTLTLAKAFGGFLASGTEAGALFQNAQNQGLKTFKLKHLKRKISLYHDLLAVWEIRNLISVLKPEIIHLNSTKAGILGSFACIGLPTKVIFTAHGFIFNEPLSFTIKNLYLALEKIASDFRHFIITVSKMDEKSALDHKLIAPNKIQTIYNGLSYINFLSKEVAINTLKLPSDKINIGTIANFYKTKGIDILIDAVSLLPEEIKSIITITIAGSGPEEENLKSKIINLKLSTTIQTVGKLDNASSYLKAFDIFILPSRKEGFPYSILEAMQAGLPIIASNTGGVIEALDNAGILTESENPQQLSQTIISLLQNEQQGKNLSQKALERSKLFTEEKMIEETKIVYEKVLKNIL